MKTLRISLIIIACIVLAVGVMAAIVLAPAGEGVEQGPLDKAYATVLADIEGIQTANPRYVDIACLGSHDSFTSALEHSARADECAPQALITLSPILSNYTYRYGKTQTVDIYSQLLQGVRFLHIKATNYQGEWYSSHSILSGKLSEHILDVLQYLEMEAAKGEIVGIIIQPVWMGDKTYNDLRNHIAKIRYNGRNLYDYVHYDHADLWGNGEGVSIQDLRYNDLTNQGQEAGVVLFERRSDHYEEAWDAGLVDYPVYYDLDSVAIHTWHDHSNARLLVAGIEATAEAIRADHTCDDKLRMNQTQASMSVQTASDLWGDLTNRSLLSIAAKHNLALIEREDFAEMLEVMPIFQVDYATSTEGDFNRRVNALIRQYNEQLVQNAR